CASASNMTRPETARGNPTEVLEVAPGFQARKRRQSILETPAIHAAAARCQRRTAQETPRRRRSARRTARLWATDAPRTGEEVSSARAADGRNTDTPTDDVPYTVAHDSRDGGDCDHGANVEVAARYQDTGRDQARLAGNGHADRLHRDGDEEDAQAVGGDELCHRIVTTNRYCRARLCADCQALADDPDGAPPSEPETCCSTGANAAPAIAMIVVIPLKRHDLSPAFHAVRIDPRVKRQRTAK